MWPTCRKRCAPRKPQRAAFRAGSSLAAIGLVAAAALPAFADDLHPRTLTVRPASRAAPSTVRPEAAAPAVAAVPTWTRTYTVAGTSYPLTFVGGDPTANAATTATVKIIPVRFVLSDGTVFDPTWPRVPGRRPFSQSALQATMASPIFQPAAYKVSGTNLGSGIQFGDAMMRATWWNAIGSSSGSNWHVNVQFAVQPVLDLSVPAANGTLSSRHRRLALVDMNWFGNAVSGAAADPTALLLYLFDQVVMCGDAPPLATTCSSAYLGIHGPTAGGAGYAYASYFDPGNWDWVSDVSVISHEVMEWLNDPSLDNPTPAWPAGPGGCASPDQPNTVLETGDPIEDLSGTSYVSAATFRVETLGTLYTLQNETLVPWFMRAQPSGAVNGQYTFVPVVTPPPGSTADPEFITPPATPPC